MSALRESEGPRVHDAIRPSVTEGFELINDDLERSTPTELQHERHVLDENPRDASFSQQSEHFTYEARSIAGNSDRLTRLTEILARESGGKEFNTVRKGSKRTDIALEGDTGKVLLEYGGRTVVDLAKKLCAMADPPKAELDSADACKQPYDLQRGTLGWLVLERFQARETLAGAVD